MVGQHATVTKAAPHQLLDDYSTDATEIGKMKPGDRVQLLDGPFYEQGLVWWQVLHEKNRLIGWMAEGDTKGRWLAPVK